MQLHEAIVAARKELKLSQKKLAEMAQIQRRQLSTLESGGNVTLNTLRKVLAQLPNLHSFSLEAVRVNVEAEMPRDLKRYHEALLGLSDSLSAFAQTLVQRGYPDPDADLAALEKIKEQARNVPPEPTQEETDLALIKAAIRQVKRERAEEQAERERFEREVERRVTERLAERLAQQQKPEPEPEG